MQPEVVGDRFELERLCGAGGMGQVWRAIDRMSGAPVALKRMHAGANAERFLREARVLSELAHPHVVGYVAHGVTASGEPFLAMEWVDGETLEQRLERGPMSMTDALELVRRVADALGAAHSRGMVHRDVKPSNVMLLGGDPRRPKLLDFGLVRMDGATRALTRTGVAMGTVGYMPPEQVRGSPDIGPAADVFALGCLLYECLSGVPAFAGENPMAVMAKLLLHEVPPLEELGLRVDPALQAVLARMLAKEAAERPPDASSVARALSELEPERAPRSVPARVLGASEQRWMSVLVVAPGEEASPDATISDPAPELRRLVSPIGGEVHALGDGTTFVALRGSGRPDERLARAARHALAIADAVRGARVVLVSGVAEVSAGLPTASLIDRAAGLVRTIETGVAVDDLTARFLERRFEIGSDGRLCAERALTSGDSGAGDGSRPYVGRERELAVLQATLEESADESVARLVLVVGPPGIGKTRLVEELMARARSGADPCFLVARGDPLYAGSPLGLARQLVDAAVSDGGLESHVKGLFRDPDMARRVAELLGELTQRPLDGEPSALLVAARHDPQCMAIEMRRAFEEWIAALCRERPLCLVLEDAHWGDVPSATYVAGLLRKHASLPLTCVCLSRPEGRELLPQLWEVPIAQELPVLGLTRRAAERLVRHALPEADEGLVARIVERADGNAFHLEELLRQVTEHGTAAELPATVLVMVQARLEALEPEARRVLRASAVFGETCWEEGVRALVGDRIDVAAHLDALVRGQVLEREHTSRFAGERELTFRHSLLREAAYAMLTDEDRALGHLLAGEWLEAVGERDARALAEHFERGGRPDRAAPWRLRAAQLALRALDFDGVLQHAERVLDLDPSEQNRGATSVLQAEVLIWKGDVFAAAPFIHDALRFIGPDDPGWIGATSWAASAALMQGDAARVEALAREIVEHVRTRVLSFTRWEANPVFFVPWSLVYLGKHGLAAELLDALRVEPATAEDAATVTAGMLLGRSHVALFRDGDPWATLEMSRQASLLCDQALPTLRSGVRQAYGAFLMTVGEFEEGERVIREALAEAEEIGIQWIASWARVNACLAPSRRRALADTRALQRACVEENVASGVVLMEGIARAGLASTMALMGDRDEAAREAERAVEILAPFGPMLAMACGVRARLAAERGELELALDVSRQARGLVEKHGTWISYEYLARLVEAEAAMALGLRDEAREAIASARDRLLDRGACIPDLEIRERFLRRMRVNARILQLAVEWDAPGA